MVKVLFFLIFVVFVMFYPLFLNSTPKKTVKSKSINLPNVEFLKGNFKLYEKNLSKSGEFKDLKMYQKEYVVDKLYLRDVIKDETYMVKKAFFKDKIITGIGVKYTNPQFELITDKATYDKEIKILEGNKFIFLSNDFKGKGKSFQIDSKKDIYAQFIKFNLKVEE